MKRAVALLSLGITLILYFYSNLFLAAIGAILTVVVYVFDSKERRESIAKEENYRFTQRLIETKLDKTLLNSHSLIRNFQQLNSRIQQMKSFDLDALSQLGLGSHHLELAGYYYFIHDYEEAIVYLNRCLIAVKSLEGAEVQKIKSLATRYLGHIDQDRGNYEKSLFYFESALNFIDDPEELFQVKQNIAILHHENAKTDEALKLYNDLISYCQEHGLKGGEAHILCLKGLVLRDQSKHDEALMLYEMGLKLINSLSTPDRYIESTKGDILRERGVSYLNLAFQYRVLKDKSREEENINLAIRSLLDSLQISEKKDDIGKMAWCYGNLGLCSVLKNNLDVGYRYHKSALDIMVKLRNKRGKANELCNIGRVFFKQGKIKKAIEYCTKAKNIHNRNYKYGFGSTCLTLATFYWKLNRRAESLQNLEEAANIFLILGNSQYTPLKELIDAIKAGEEVDDWTEL
jgi:tetratricopeptide (TPR) repeat protein